MPLSAISPRLRQHAPTLLGFALILAMSISLAWQTADWLRLLREPVTVTSSEGSRPHSRALDPQLGQLFGASQASGDAPAPATSLRLTLLGSFVHADPHRSSAIIRSEGSSARRYLIDEEISSGVRLHAVAADHVQLLRNGRRESLSFPQAAGDSRFSAPEQQDNLEQLRALEDDNMTQLRERMEALREQMQVSGALPNDNEPEAQPTETP
ncbi:type II secretion system protein N [Pseudomonas xionganensis]|uniref:Secretion protein XcpP n=1 Tax=Pseudomonas xionganensis TaxID=2654845 RepID=A0A6I4L065_9PSED|nr:type II secretion system protein N [Pseudomonas xionganensis]MVW77274.1 secretion protein XcpP [Pseudomonas xionganensis]